MVRKSGLIISILAALVLCFSLISTAFAADLFINVNTTGATGVKVFDADVILGDNGTFTISVPSDAAQYVAIGTLNGSNTYLVAPQAKAVVKINGTRSSANKIYPGESVEYRTGSAYWYASTLSLRARLDSSATPVIISVTNPLDASSITQIDSTHWQGTVYPGDAVEFWFDASVIDGSSYYEVHNTSDASLSYRFYSSDWSIYYQLLADDTVYFGKNTVPDGSTSVQYYVNESDSVATFTIELKSGTAPTPGGGGDSDYNGILGSILGAISDGFNNVVSSITSAISSAVNAIITPVTNFFSEIRARWEESDGLIDFFLNPDNREHGGVGRPRDEIVPEYSNDMDGVGDFFTGLDDGAIGFLNDLYSWPGISTLIFAVVACLVVGAFIQLFMTL